jgi:phage tail-like protein
VARGYLSDYLQVFPFWLADIGPLNTFSLPVLTPVFGFSQITSPEITVEIEQFKEGNWMFDRKVVKSASMTPMTLSRGVTLFESDFSNWMKAALYGDTQQFSSVVPLLNVGGPTYRRTLMLIHFFQRTVSDPPKGGDDNNATVAGDAERAALLGLGVSASDVVAGLTLGGLLFGLTRGLNSLLGTPFEFAARIPARAYILYGCIPSRYKAGSDFDATAGDISIQELELQVEMMEQISLV